eukprot:3435387-Alexandrium_andersonii.AAC.1
MPFSGRCVHSELMWPGWPHLKQMVRFGIGFMGSSFAARARPRGSGGGRPEGGGGTASSHLWPRP